MRKKVTIALFISLMVLIVVFALTVIKQNDAKREAEAEQLRIEQEAEKLAEERAAEAEKEAEEAAKEAESNLDENGYSYTDMEESFYAQSKATVRELPNDTAEIIGTLSLDSIVSVVAKCDQTDYYKIKINGDFGYISTDEVSEEYIDIPLPISGDVVVPSATKEILFIGNSITKYPATEDWWGSGWGCGASTIDKDYTHLTIAAKGYSSYDIMSMRKWEFSNTRNYELSELDGYIKNYQYSTVVIELGENVKGHENHFKSDLTDMIKYIKTYNPNARIVMVDNFWKFDSIISTKKAVASEVGASYVSLSDIQGIADYQWQEGQTYTTEAGVTYTLNSFLAGHPNDAGYAAIAERLIAAL